MNVASLPLCRELYELSGLDSDDLRHSLDGSIYTRKLFQSDLRGTSVEESDYCPLYDAGYLLRQLGYPTLGRNVYGHWLAKYYYKTPKSLTGPMNALGSADIPEDALVKLAIVLFKAGVLKKEGQTGDNPL